MDKNNDIFPGFPPLPVTNYWPYPKALNGWWYSLTPTEQKVLDYLLRHTWGFNKTFDSISISQFRKGITKRDGTILDKGTGIKDEKTVRKALHGLVTKQFILCEQIQGRENIYRLKISSSQEMAPGTYNGNSLLPNNNPSDSSQNKASTIKDLSIKDNNNIPDKQDSNKEKDKGEIQEMVNYLSSKLGRKFPNYAKQCFFVKRMLDSEYSLDDIRWTIDSMFADKWWLEHSFDMKNIADEIPKRLTRTYSIKEVKNA